MIQQLKLEHILFLDIETVPFAENFNDVSKNMQELFTKKTEYQRKDSFSPEEFYDKAGIWAEFGKIICISVGYFVNSKNERQFRTTSFTGDENQLLLDFKKLLESHFNTPKHLLCAHNGKEFDFPYIARRMIIQNITLPNKLNLFGKKPWEISHLDTLELWKFGDYKHYTSLQLLTSILNIPSSKNDINGSQVKDVYYKEKNIKRIALYCEKDTVAVAQVFLKFRQEPILQSNEIISV